MSPTIIEKLLNGAEVEWKPLGEIVKIKTGALINKNTIQNNPGVYPVINSGKEPLGYIKYWNTECDPIGITTRGAGVGSVTWQEGRYFRGNLNYSVTIKDNKKLLVRYLFYSLTSQQKDIQNLATYSGIPALNAAELKKLRVPVPPLSVQKEIVRILDAFTAHTAELTAELNERKKQYNYYRDKLLTFSDEEVEWKTLGDIGEVRMCKRILKHQTSENGDVPFYKIGTFGKRPDAYISRELFNDYKKKYNYPKIGEVLISASGTIGRTVIFDGSDAYFQDSNIVWIENDESQVLNKYLFYYYKIAKWGASEGGTIARLYNDNLRKVAIPIPTLAEQQRIVDILDKFDALTTSITQGLPREIELRQKQYEYYRDQLLNFPKPENDAIKHNSTNR